MGKGIHSTTLAAGEYDDLLNDQSSNKILPADEYDSLLGNDQPPTQKKNPSETTSATNSQPSQNGSSENNDQVTPSFTTPQGVVNKIFGTNPEGEPIVTARAPEDEKLATANAAHVLSSDVVNNMDNLPFAYKQTASATPITDPNNPINKVSDPHGDAEFTGGYAIHRIGQLDQQRQQELVQVGQYGMNGPLLREGKTAEDVNAEYDQKIKNIKDAADHIVSLQLFNKEYTQKPLTQELAATNIDALQKQRGAALKTANESFETNPEIQGYMLTDKAKANQLKDDRINSINRQFNSEINQVKSKTKWDATRIGIQQSALLGDNQAIQDAKKYDAGIPLSQEASVRYQTAGNEVLLTGAKQAAANGQEQVVNEAMPHIKTQQQIEQDNLPYFKQVWANQVGNVRYNNESPARKALGALVPYGGDVPKEEVEKYGEEAGLTPEQIKQIDPSEVPTATTIWGQFAKGALNTAAPIYERALRSAAYLSGADNEAVNEHFKPGWENQEGLGAAVVGNMPSDQNRIHDVRSFVGQMMEGAGGLSTFAGEVGGVAKGIEGLGLAKTAVQADKMANFSVMAFNGYNSAYNNSKDVIGDKPEDEWKRQAYAITNGIIEGSIFSMQPKTQLVKNALGIETKSGEQLLDEIKNADNIGVLETPQFKDKIANYIVESSKELGTQVGLAAANQIAKNTVDALVDPTKTHSIDDNLKQTAASTAISMLIPSLLGGIGHEDSKTPLNAAAAFEIGTNPSKYTDLINDQLLKGAINKNQYNTMQDGIRTMRRVIDMTPTENEAGVKLTPDQIKDYSYNLFQENILRRKADGIENTATSAGVEPDKAQLEPLNKRISELQKQRADIYKSAGKITPPAPVAEENPKEERSVATDDEKRKEVDDQNNSQKTTSELKEPLPLTQQEQQTKNSENEKENDRKGGEHASIETNEGGQVSTEESDANEVGTNSDLRQAASGRLPGEQEDRQLETENKENEGGAYTQPPISVSARLQKLKKKRLIAADEEPEQKQPSSEISLTQKPEFSAWDQGTEEGQPAATHKKQIEEAPHDEKIGGAESFTDFRDRIKKAWENLKGTAKDKSLLIAHSGVMKMINAAEEHGWDNLDELRKAYNGEKEPPVGEIQQHRTTQGELFMTRHGQSEDNADGLLRTKDAELTEKGQEQAKTQIADKLKEEGVVPSEIISSDLPRAQETAEIVHGEFTKPSKKGENVSEVEKENELPLSEEELNQAPNEERSVATEPQSAQEAKQTKKITNEDINQKEGKRNDNSSNETESSQRKSGSSEREDRKENPIDQSPNERRLQEIDEALQRQRASQKLEGQKRTAAEKEKNFADANLHNANWYKKQERIDKLQEERNAIQNRLDRQQREDNIKKSYNDFADKIEKKYEKNKKEHEGIALSGILGISAKIGDHVADFLVARAIEGIRDLSNIHIAIDRAIRLAKEKFGEEAGDLTRNDNKAIREHLLSLGQKEPEIKHEPVLPIDHEEYAKDMLADIKSGTMTYDQAVQEITHEVIENRNGNPASDHVQENNRAKMLKYLDYHLQNDLTSIKNDTTRLRRIQMGLDKEIPAAKKEFGDTWEEAQEKIAQGYDPQSLIQELSQKARPLTDVENAILLHQQNTKEIALMNLNDKINKAVDQGDVAGRLEAKVAKARVLDELQKIYDINKAVGTENARGLASRRMMVDRKYSLVNMIAEKRATANNGEALSEEQEAQVEKLHQKIKETQDAFDDYVKQAESQIIDAQRKALATPLKDKKSASAKLREWADKIENSSKNQDYSSPIPITPKMVADGMRLVADGLDKGGELIDLVKEVVSKISGSNPGVDKQQLEKEINKSLLDANILVPSAKRKDAKDMSSLFSGGKLDREAVRLKVEAERAKAQYEFSLKKDQEKELSKFAKAQNFFIKLQRAFKLSSPLTLAKLTTAAAVRVTTTPLEDIVGGLYSAVLPQLAKGAIGEGGGLHVRETADAMKEAIMHTAEDVGNILSRKNHGKSQLDVLFGKTGELPPEALDIFGQIHSAIKAPVKRFAFERSLSKRLRRTIAFGGDPTDPVVLTGILSDAYKDANRAIFMQDNKVAEGWQKMVGYFDRVDPKTGKAPLKGLSTVSQWLLPFVKVSSNITSEAGTHIYGVPVAAAKLIYHGFTKGIENLPPDQKDIILRNLKKGSLGLAAMSLGYFNPQNFGGFYQPGQKRDDEDAPVLGLKLWGEKIPAWFSETPIFLAMQFGATMRRVKDSKIQGNEQGIGEGLWASASGLAQRSPFIAQPVEMAKIFKSKYERDQYLEGLATGTIDPAIISYLAKVTDPADEGNPIRKALEPENKRKNPKTLVDHIKSGLPFFREELEEKNPRPVDNENVGKY